MRRRPAHPQPPSVRARRAFGILFSIPFSALFPTLALVGTRLAYPREFLEDTRRFVRAGFTLTLVLACSAVGFAFSAFLAMAWDRGHVNVHPLGHSLGAIEVVAACIGALGFELATSALARRRAPATE